MRYDLFQDKKSIHIKLTKETHAALREKVFRYGVTMQDLFEEMTEIILSQEDRADKLLQKVFKKKMAATLEKIDKRNKLSLGEFDSETLYSLLEDADNETKNGTEKKD